MITELDTRDPLDDDLRTLDAAAGDLTPETLEKARILLGSIVGAPDEAPGRVVPLRRRPRRWWLLAGAAAALAVGGMLLPGWIQTPAFASWRAVPESVPDPVRAEATEACAKALSEAGKPMPGMPADQQPLAPGIPTVQLAEARGDYVLVALATANGAEFTCLSTLVEPARLLSAGGGIPTAGSDPFIPGVGEIDGGPSYQSVGSTGFAVAMGRVGPKVEAVTIHADGKTVTATVTGGRFVAWWPVGVIDATSGLDVRYDVTLTGGRVITDAYNGSHRQTRPGPREIGTPTQSFGVTAGGKAQHGVAGLAGAEVAAVTVHSEGKDIVATVADGTYSATWPVPEVNVEDPPEPTFTVTLRDGTVLENVTPVGR